MSTQRPSIVKSGLIAAISILSQMLDRYDRFEEMLEGLNLAPFSATTHKLSRFCLDVAFWLDQRSNPEDWGTRSSLQNIFNLGIEVAELETLAVTRLSPSELSECQKEADENEGPITYPAILSLYLAIKTHGYTGGPGFTEMLEYVEAETKKRI